MSTAHLLTLFGLTGQEARLYEALYALGDATGYALSSKTGISRSNTYAALISLESKGAVRSSQGKPVLYQAVPVAEFCEAVLAALQKAKQRLEESLKPADTEAAPYLTIKGSQNIVNKILHMIEHTEFRIYLSMAKANVQRFLEPLCSLADQGKKVVVITDAPLPMPGAVVHCGAVEAASVRLITDSAVALTGELCDDADCTCLYSRKPNLVTLLKDSIKNEIALIGYQAAKRRK